eukprot:CAMPEP_0171977870 /NCGR_PEP_ID=MMETSP0993-20121228/249391_1 /TAXON_ID=483369 /ORGANISM="non described non described, Strain CCMP2098" /LENGTH=51 /DNA_ID=CAMNT_0012629693 /DNA_START=36 /DNA_END=191 /DNA_ORIENTATION=-
MSSYHLQPLGVLSYHQNQHQPRAPGPMPWSREWCTKSGGPKATSRSHYRRA